MDLDELLNSTDPSNLPEPDLTENAKTVLERRYLLTDDEGNINETPAEMFWRVAKTIARPSIEYGKDPYEVKDLALRFYKAMASGKFMPNSPTLTGAGTELGMLSACFVYPVEDTMTNEEGSGILDTAKNAALTHKTGGGTGFNFSKLRPKGDPVQSTNGVASGPVSFMKMYSDITNTMKQGGTRRGANMGILHVDHPDIMRFINAKTEGGEIENFNISVAVTDEFMEKARQGEEYELVYEGEVYDTLNASDVLDQIINNAHKNGEPGLFFVERANEDNPIPHLGDIRATNPCGEQPLPPYGSCNLGHVNIAEFVEDGEIDWSGLEEAVSLGVRFLDNVIDANEYPLPEVRERIDKTRRIGLGVMGWADMLIQLGIPYNSGEAVELARDLSAKIGEYAEQVSIRLAEERGPFLAFEESLHTTPRRNAYVTTVAPTGTTSILGGCSGGIEPNYAFAFKRHQADTEMLEVHDAVTERYGDDVTENHDLSEIRDLVADDDVLVSAHEIAPDCHIRHQAAWQENIETCISKTINYSTDADPSDVRDGYLLAWKLNCKGITVYRDGSREGQALSMGDDDETPESGSEGLGNGTEERPSTLTGETTRIEAPEGNGYLTLNYKHGQPFESFINVGKTGGSVMAVSEGFGRLISLGLRNGIDVADVYEQLRGIGSRNEQGFGENRVGSLPDAIAKGLEHLMGDGVDMNATDTDGTIASCPDCGSDLAQQEGCLMCRSCGYSKCS